MEKNIKTLNVTVEVKAVNFQNGNVMETKATLTKTGDDRNSIADEDTLRFRGSDCGKANMEVDYKSSSQGTGEQTTEVDLEIKGGILKDRKDVIEVISAQSKLKTVFGGRNANEIIEDNLNLKIENGCDAKCATTDSSYTTKTSEIK